MNFHEAERNREELYSAALANMMKTLERVLIRAAVIQVPSASLALDVFDRARHVTNFPYQAVILAFSGWPIIQDLLHTIKNTVEANWKCQHDGARLVTKTNALNADAKNVNEILDSLPQIPPDTVLFNLDGVFVIGMIRRRLKTKVEVELLCGTVITLKGSGNRFTLNDKNIFLRDI